MFFLFCFVIASFTQCNYSEIYSCCSLSVCSWDAFHCMAISVYSPVDGHLDCLQYLTTTNKAAINLHIYFFMWAYTFISLHYMLSHHHNTEEVNGWSYDRHMLNFYKYVKLYSKMVIPFYIPISSVWEFQLLHILINNGTHSLFNFSHYNRSIVVLSLWFHFTLNTDLMEASCF